MRNQKRHIQWFNGGWNRQFITYSIQYQCHQEHIYNEKKTAAKNYIISVKILKRKSKDNSNITLNIYNIHSEISLRCINCVGSRYGRLFWNNGNIHWMSRHVFKYIRQMLSVCPKWKTEKKTKRTYYWIVFFYILHRTKETYFKRTTKIRCIFQCVPHFFLQSLHYLSITIHLIYVSPEFSEISNENVEVFVFDGNNSFTWKSTYLYALYRLDFTS